MTTGASSPGPERRGRDRERTRRRGLVVAAIALSVLALSVVWIAKRYDEQPLDIETRAGGLVRVGDRSRMLRFAVAPVLSPERTVDDFRLLSAYLEQKIRRPVRVVQRKTYHEVNELVRTGEAHLALICTGAYLDAIAARLPVEVLAVPYYPDGPTYTSLVIVRASSGIRTFEALEGRSFAYTDPMSLSGHYYVLAHLLESHRDPRSFFSSTPFTYSHDASIRAVLDGVVDGAAVDSLVYAYETSRNPSIQDRLRVVHESPNLGVAPVVVPASTPTDLRDRLRDAFLEMGSSETGRLALRRLGIVRFGLPPEGLYDDAALRVATVRRFLEAGR